MSNILLVSHYTDTPGVMHKLSAYLKKHNHSISFILNPLDPTSQLESIIKIKNKKISYKIYWRMQYALEGIVFLINYFFLIKQKLRFRLAICFDPLSFIHIYFLRWFLPIDEIVYFNVDYSTRRFRNQILNYLYLVFNKYAFYKCDYFFSLTKTFVYQIDPQNKYKEKTFFLKHTISSKNARQIKKNANSLVYAGNLSKTVDFTNLIEALELISQENINFTFDIYGDINQNFNLKSQILNSSISKSVSFKGLVTNEVLVTKILPKYRIGVAPYISKNGNTESNHMFMGTDLTTKLVEYIGVGLPVITTRLFAAFDSIELNNFGYIVNSTEEWKNAIKKLLLNESLYSQLRLNALRFAENYDEEKLYDPIFERLLK
jgi:glycosyltransferase involved in cell wall biosynthesis